MVVPVIAALMLAVVVATPPAAISVVSGGLVFESNSFLMRTPTTEFDVDARFAALEATIATLVTALSNDSMQARIAALEGQVDALQSTVASLTSIVTNITITGPCAQGLVMSGVSADGHINCVSDRDTFVSKVCDAGTVLSSVLGAAATCTPYVVQRQVVQGCPPGSTVQRIGVNGSVSCAVDMNTHIAGACRAGGAVSGISNDQLNCVDVASPADLDIMQRAIIRDVSILIANTSNTNLTANADIVNLLHCASVGLTWNPTTQKCEPAFVHLGCPVTGSAKWGGNCTGHTAFNANCTLYCPAGTVGHANFTCGAFGEWAAVAQEPVCTPVPCPAYTVNYPACTCAPGYQGAFTWAAPAGTYVGACVAAPCPEHSAGSPLQCICNDIGYQTTAPGWLSSTQSYEPCIRVDCPSLAVGFPNCACNASVSFGNLSWAPSTATWVGNCTRRIISDEMCGESPEHTTLTVDCGVGFFINDVTWASYDGAASCQNGKHISCGADLTAQVREQCVGRQSCDVPATNEQWGDPCPGIFKALNLFYNCIDYRTL